MLNIPLRTPSNPVLSPKETNEIISILRGLFTTRRMISSRAGTSSRDNRNLRDPIEVSFENDYPPYSIFSGTFVNRTFTHSNATSNSTDVIDPTSVASDEAQFYITNGTHAVSANSVHPCWLIGLEEPRLIRYQGSAPTIGKKLGVVAGQNYLQLDINGEFVAVSEPNTSESLIWVIRIPQSSQISIEIDIIFVEAVDCIEPGQSGTAKKLQTSGTDWIPIDPQENIEIYDSEVSNMLLPGDRVWVKTRPASGGDIGDIIGEHGLLRPAKITGTTGDISCGGSTTVTIYQSTSASCSEPVASNCTVSACYNFLDTRKIDDTEEFWIRWTGTQWNILTGHKPRWLVGQLDANLCGEATVSVSNLTFLDGCTTPVADPVTAFNDFSLAGTSGDLVLMIKDETDQHIIVQVNHHLKENIDDIRYNNCSIEKSVYQAMTMNCGNSAWETGIQLYQNSLVSGFRHDANDSSHPERCQDVALYKDYCLFENKGQAAADSEEIIADYGKWFVLQDVFASGTTIYGTGLNIWVRCWDDPEVIELIQGTDCSQSGSGQQ